MTDDQREFLIREMNRIVDEILKEGLSFENATRLMKAREIYNELRYGVRA